MTAVAYEQSTRGGKTPGTDLPSGAGAFLLWTIVLATAATVGTSLTHQGHVSWRNLIVLVVAGAMAQLFAVHTASNQVLHTGLAFTVAAALLLPPEAVVIVCCAQHIPEWLRQRYPWYIQAFNIANFTLGALAAWGTYDVAGRIDLAVGTPSTDSVIAAATAGAAFVLVNHVFLARMLKLARGHDLNATGLFSVDGLMTDLVLASIGIGIAFALSWEPAAAPIAALPLVLIHRVLVLPSLRAQALKDHKTGLLNMRGIEQLAGPELTRARRFGRPLSVLMVDLDGLRDINNRHGHLAGDAALVELADAFRAELRDYDLCARFGGDEFVVVLPETSLEETLAVARRIEGRVDNSRVHVHGGETVSFGVSIGAASRSAGDLGLHALMRRADAELYAAKRAARQPAPA
jgi:diguanylate cyclase (GGDEF)-like protein